jgi:hypothetical protein
MALGRCQRFFRSQSLGVYRPNISEHEYGDRMDQKEQILSTINQMVDAFHEGDPVFAGSGTSFADARAFIQRIESAQRVIELHRNSLRPSSASDIAELVVAAIDSVAPTRARADELARPRH